MKDTDKKTTLTILSFGVLALLIVLLVPMFAVSRYDVPLYDDYIYGMNTTKVWDATHSAGAVFLSAVDTAARCYQEWQGSYTATFLMSLQPGIYGLSSYRWTFVIMTVSLLLGIFCLVRSVGRHVLGLSWQERLLMFSLLSVICTQFLPSPLEGLYWYNGSCFYTLCFSFAMIFFALWICFLHRKPGKKRNFVYYAVIPVLAALLAGGNYSTGLLIVLLLAALTVWQFLLKKKNLLPLVTLLVFTGLFLFNIKCPANNARQFYSGFSHIFRSGVKAVMKALASAADWTNLPILFAGLAVIPTAVRFARRSAFRFRRPWLVAVASFFLLAAGYMPTLYTQDYTGSNRLLDIQFYLYILLLFLNIFYTTGWMCNHLKIGTQNLLAPHFRRSVRAGLVILALLSCAGSYKDFTAYKSGRDLLNGTAATYYSEWEQRWKICRSSAGKDVVLTPLTVLPEVLIDYDMGPGKLQWENEVFCFFFDLKTVRVTDQTGS